jgi:hypothetical protein
MSDPRHVAAMDQAQASVRDVIDRLGADANNPDFIAGAMFGIGLAGEYVKYAHSEGELPDPAYVDLAAALTVIAKTLYGLAGH